VGITAEPFAAPMRVSVGWNVPKKKSLSFFIGPPKEKPNEFWV